MKYMPILPIGMFHVFDRTDVRDVFILPQFWDNESYREFYTSHKWDHVIIDNAMYEQLNGVPFGHLINIADQLDADRVFIVSPEDIRNPYTTAAYAVETGDRFGFRDSNWEMMCILHGTPYDMVNQYYTLRKYPMGYGIAVSAWRSGYDRAGIFKYVGFRDKDYVHAMGWDSIIEIFALNNVGFDSIDSSIVATAAVNRIMLGPDTVIRRTGSVSDPKRVDLLQTTFSTDETLSCVNNIHSVREYLV